jgi:predicted O-linked N-acetylglucosamine transferase (SPINDLY family)
VLNVSPRHPDALHLAGVIELQQGRAAAALELFARAIKINDRDPAYFCHHGDACADLDRFESAIRSYDRAIALRPDYAEAYANRGYALAAIRNYAAAVASYDRATEIEPDFAIAWCDRGNPLRSLGRAEDALASYDRALALRPDMAVAWNNRGSALLDLERCQDAIISFDRALALRPGIADVWCNRGISQAKIGLRTAALESFERTLALRPDHAEAWANRGLVLFEMGRAAEALSCCDRAVSSQPDFALGWYNRGTVLSFLGPLADALDNFERAIVLRPDYSEALSDRVHARYLACDWRNRTSDDAVVLDLVNRGLQVAPFVLLPTSASAADQLHCARQWGRQFPRSPGPLASPQTRDPQRRLTLGYVSGDFRQHPLAYLVVDLLERHDRERFEVICYSVQPDDGSAIRRRIAQACDRFVELAALPDLAAAQAIARDGTDILVDLSGYTRYGRPVVLARRPAPIQVGYLGYIGSMGADFVDYIVADPVALPMAQQAYYDEKIVHLPVCYQPNGDSREISARRVTRTECGLPERGFVFCCFNSSYKITPDVFGSWMRLLGSLPGSVLWLIKTDPLVETNLRRAAAERGIDPERLVFSPYINYGEYLARCSIADLFLDTLPYSAGATASDVLWAGLPLVTRAGSGFAGRMAASVLTAIGLPQLITETETEYEQLAWRLATEPMELAKIREFLRHSGRASSLFDAGRCARNLEAAYAEMWRRLCEGHTAGNFAVAEMSLP